MATQGQLSMAQLETLNPMDQLMCGPLFPHPLLVHTIQYNTIQYNTIPYSGYVRRKAIMTFLTALGGIYIIEEEKNVELPQGV